MTETHSHHPNYPEDLYQEVLDPVSGETFEYKYSDATYDIPKDFHKFVSYVTYRQRNSQNVESYRYWISGMIVCAAEAAKVWAKMSFEYDKKVPVPPPPTQKERRKKK